MPGRGDGNLWVDELDHVTWPDSRGTRHGLRAPGLSVKKPTRVASGRKASRQVAYIPALETIVHVVGLEKGAQGPPQELQERNGLFEEDVGGKALRRGQSKH